MMNVSNLRFFLISFCLLVLAACSAGEDNAPVTNPPEPTAAPETAVSTESTAAAPTQTANSSPTPEPEAAQATAVALPTVELPEVTPPVGAPPTTQPTATPRPTTMPTPDPTLAPEWYVDSDGNAIPDFIELAAGFDPLADDCAPTACQMAEDSSALAQEENVLIILDASGSMAEPFGSQTRMAAAKEALADYVTLTADLANIGLLVYGHEGDNTEAGKPESCASVELLGDFGSLSAANAPDVLAQFAPNGWTPIAGALETAESILADKVGAANRVILVTDGLETCGGDPLAVAARLHAQPDIEVMVDVIGLGLASSDEAAQLAGIAAAGGGSYVDAPNREALRRYWQARVDAVFARRDFAICVVQNSVNYSVCSDRLLIDATVEINLARTGVSGAAAEAELVDLLDLIQQQHDAADARFQSYRDEMDQLLEAARERDRQRLELFGDE